LRGNAHYLKQLDGLLLLERTPIKWERRYTLITQVYRLFAPYPIPIPTGVDFETAGALGIKAIWALSLPGKVAPVTAGKVIKNTIYNILSELGV